MKSWGDVLLEGSICLTLEKIYSPSDLNQRDFETRQQRRLEAEVGKRHDLLEHRYEHSLIHLLRANSLYIALQRSISACGILNVG